MPVLNWIATDGIIANWLQIRPLCKLLIRVQRCGDCNRAHHTRTTGSVLEGCKIPEQQDNPTTKFGV